MGNLNGRSKKGLQVSEDKAPAAHERLGIAVVFPSELVFDADKTKNGKNKWLWLNKDADKLLLNPQYQLSEQEQRLFELHFIVQILKTEGNMEAFYSPTTGDFQKMRLTGGSRPALELLERFATTYKAWAQQTSTYWCNLPGLDGRNAELVAGVTSWLEARNQPTSGSAPHELFARFCALRTGALKPAPRIMRWAKALKLDLENDPDAAVRMYCRVHLLNDDDEALNFSIDLSQRTVSVQFSDAVAVVEQQQQQPSQDPFWSLKNALIAEANSNLQDRKIQRLVLEGTWQGPVPGLPLCGDPTEMRSRVALFRWKHVSRHYLTSTLEKCGLAAESMSGFPARVLDLILMAVSGRQPLSSLKEIEGFESLPQADLGRLQDGYNALRNNEDISLEFLEEDKDQYLDYLAEYGFPALLISPLFPAKVLRGVAQNLNLSTTQSAAEVRSAVLSKFDSVLSITYIKSWLRDRKFDADRAPVAKDQLAFLRDKYLQYSRCLYHSEADKTCANLSEEVSDALRPNLDVWKKEPHVGEGKLVPSVAPQWGNADVGNVPQLFADAELIAALHLISDSVLLDEPARVKWLCALLNVKCAPHLAGVKIYDALIAKLMPDSSILDVLLNMAGRKPPHSARNPKRFSVIQKLRAITQVNDQRREALKHNSVRLVLQTTDLSGARTVEFKQLFSLHDAVIVSAELLQNYKVWYFEVGLSEGSGEGSAEGSGEGSGVDDFGGAKLGVLLFVAEGKPKKRIKWAQPHSAESHTLDGDEWKVEHIGLTLADAHALLTQQEYVVFQFQ